MKPEEIRIGRVYTARVSGREVPVKVIRKHPHGGWFAVNLETDRTVKLASAQLHKSSVAG